MIRIFNFVGGSWVVIMLSSLVCIFYVLVVVVCFEIVIVNNVDGSGFID